MYPEGNIGDRREIVQNLKNGVYPPQTRAERPKGMEPLGPQRFCFSASSPLSLVLGIDQNQSQRHLLGVYESTSRRPRGGVSRTCLDKQIKVRNRRRKIELTEPAQSRQGVGDEDA